MGEHRTNPVALAHHDQPEPVLLQQMVLMQRTAPDAIIIPGKGAPRKEYRLIIQVGKRSSTIGKRLQVVLKDGASAVDVARVLVASANYLLSVDQDRAAFDESTTTAEKGNGKDHEEAGGEGQTDQERADAIGALIAKAEANAID